MAKFSFQYTAQFLASIERTISRERLNRYLAATQQDIVKALEFYEYNVALSEALFGYLHGLEIAVRNAIHHELTSAYGTPHWYVHAPLSTYHKDKIKEAIQDAGQNTTAGKVIAELTFSFWTGLIAQRYHGTLWVPYLHRAFPNARKHRNYIHRRLVLQRGFEMWCHAAPESCVEGGQHAHTDRDRAQDGVGDPRY